MKILIAIIFALSTLAHEGHDHDAPTSIPAPKGGIVKALDEARVEAVSKGKDLKVFVYDKDMKPLSTKGFSLKATAELPRSKKTEEVKLEAKENSFEGSYDAKGLHRYTLKLQITAPGAGHSDTISFTIEPRK
jgi:hypothetical protein